MTKSIAIEGRFHRTLPRFSVGRSPTAQPATTTNCPKYTNSAIEGRFSVPCPASAGASCRVLSLPPRRNARLLLPRAQPATTTNCPLYPLAGAAYSKIRAGRALPDKSGKDTLKRSSMAGFDYFTIIRFWQHRFI